MDTLAASTKTLERWSGRLNDKSSDVRKEALKTVGQIAETESCLAITSLNTLASFISENKYGEDCGDALYALWAIQEMPPQLILKSPQLVWAILEAPLEHAYNANAVARILLELVESGGVSRVGSFLKDIIQKSKSSTLLAHQGGRRDFMKIVDWAEDNDVHVPAALPKKAAEIKPRSKRPAALNSPDDAGSTPAVGDQRTALPPQEAPFILDHNQIHQKQAESENVSEYLSQFFNPEEPENPQSLVAANSSAARFALSGLEPILFAFALRLASRAKWKRADAEALAASLGLMVDGALEHLNDAAHDEWDVLFAYGYDPIELSAEAIAGLARQAQAAAPS